MNMLIKLIGGRDGVAEAIRGCCNSQEGFGVRQALI